MLLPTELLRNNSFINTRMYFYFLWKGKSKDLVSKKDSYKFALLLYTFFGGIHREYHLILRNEKNVNKGVVEFWGSRQGSNLHLHPLRFTVSKTAPIREHNTIIKNSQSDISSFHLHMYYHDKTHDYHVNVQMCFYFLSTECGHSSD